MTNNPNSINSIESNVDSSKSSRFLENTKRAVRNVLVKTGIAASTMTPMTTTTTSTVIPASVNTITAIAPLASTTIKTISLGTAAGLLAACGGSEDEIDGPIDTKDTIAPTINVSKSEIDITGGKQVSIEGNKLYIGGDLIASRTDNKTTNCNVSLSLNGKSITSGTTISEEGTLTIKVSDAVGNYKNADIKLSVAAEQESISGLENIRNLNMQVDQEVNLLNGVTFSNGAQLVKTEIELDGEKTEILDPNHYIPPYPGTCSIILTVKNKNGETKEYKVDNLTIKALEYKAIEINNIEPVEILPIIGQIDTGDTGAYEHIKPLRVAEATRIRDMMREYGAGNHTAEEYKQLMMRLNTGMRGEHPKGYDNFEVIGGGPGGEASEHAHNERDILNTLVSKSNFKVVCPIDRDWEDVLIEYVKNNPNSINIFGCSSYTTTSKKNEYDIYINRKNIRDLCKLKNFIMFAAGTNIKKDNQGHIKNKIYNGEYEADENGLYSLASLSNSDKNDDPNTHLLVTVATDKDGIIDQTDETVESSKFPVGFANNVLFSGRAFPYRGSDGKIYAEGGNRNNGKYSTSFTNYLNVAIVDLCFQMKADVSDVNELLNMIRSTCLTDHIKFNGKDQPLQLMNPAGFFKKYLMPTDTPSSIQSSKTMSLDKGYYKGVIFDIPGAEVKINGEWIAYNDTNKSKIKSQNPMTLEWRLNGDLCRKLGYKGNNIEGKIIVVDDKWNGLNIDKDFSVNMR